MRDGDGENLDVRAFRNGKDIIAKLWTDGTLKARCRLSFDDAIFDIEGIVSFFGDGITS